MAKRVRDPVWALLLVVASTVVGLMGTDLVLPAVPGLPETLGGDAAAAQLVLASYVAGTCLGLLAFGALGDRVATRTLFTASLLLTALVSFACAAAPSIGVLVLLRFVQGAVAAGPAVFAPGIVRALYDEARAIRAIGALGSVESLVPALAPILGVWLLALGDWRLSFTAIAAAALLLFAVNLALPLIPQASRRPDGHYRALLLDPVFVRYALSQALVLGGLLVFVFGAPAMFVRSHGGSLGDFIVMQVVGVGAFIVAANLSGPLVARFGAERLIAGGTLLAALGALAMLVYALAGGRAAPAVTALFAPVGLGLGLRGPPGFYRAVLAARGDDARGSALVILAIMATAAAGTALVAPFIHHGLFPLALAAFALEAGALLFLLLLPPLPDR